jgi:hypothetical protein
MLSFWDQLIKWGQYAVPRLKGHSARLFPSLLLSFRMLGQPTYPSLQFANYGIPSSLPNAVRTMDHTIHRPYHMCFDMAEVS